jgi:2'-5' RNA ligase
LSGHWGQFTRILETIRPEATPQQEYAIILNAPPEISEALDDVRRRYDPAFKVKVPPHITVKRPTVLAEPARLEKVREALRGVAASLPPVPIALKGFGKFNSPGRNVVFLKVEDERPLFQLHERVSAALREVFGAEQADHFENGNYHPHLTIGNELSEIDLAVLEHELVTSGYRLDFDFTISQFSLYVHDTGKPWETIETFTFNPPSPIPPVH